MSKNQPEPAPIGKDQRNLRVLVAPLDWGLGHATRCIPVITELLRRGADVFLAGEGAQENLLREAFPHLPFLPLSGYRVRYAKRGGLTFFRLLLQIPGILEAMREEHRWLKKTMRDYQFDIVISDNRYGLFHPDCRSVLVTHQLQLKTPVGKWAEPALRRKIFSLIQKFDECWIPDSPKQPFLAGDLSHPQTMPSVPCRYIGWLSRLQKTDIALQPGHLFISLSGPEPQRTVLENIVIRDIARYPGTATIVRGLPGTLSLIPSTNDIQFHNHLPADEYSEAMQAAEFVIARSGYSTVMDVVRAGKKAIFIPTPGQTEQEYLGTFLEHTGVAVSVSQDKFELGSALQKAQQFSFATFSVEDDLLVQAVGKLFHTL